MSEALVLRPCRDVQVKDLGKGHTEYLNFTCKKHCNVLTGHDLIFCLGISPKDKMPSCFSCYEERPLIIHNPVTGKDYEVKSHHSRKKHDIRALCIVNPKKESL